jgi:hypothetical protein
MELELNLFKNGGSYAARIPKVLIDCKVIDPKKKYILIFKEVTEDLNTRADEHNAIAPLCSDRYTMDKSLFNKLNSLGNFDFFAKFGATQ